MGRTACRAAHPIGGSEDNRPGPERAQRVEGQGAPSTPEAPCLSNYTRSARNTAHAPNWRGRAGAESLDYHAQRRVPWFSLIQPFLRTHRNPAILIEPSRHGRIDQADRSGSNPTRAAAEPRSSQGRALGLPPVRRGAFVFLTLARVWQPGMFSDGLLYACISRNLAQGIGSFWIPSYTSTDYPVFLEHPPLAFGLQAAAFFFGDHLFVERGYALVMGAGTGLLVMMIWRSTVGGKSHDWLPLVFWLLPSLPGSSSITCWRTPRRSSRRWRGLR